MGGSTWRRGWWSGTITCPGTSRAPGPENDGRRAIRNPESLEIENADGRSQYGMSFDDFGRRFICMNRLPVQHVVLSSKLLARNPRLAFSETVQDCSERSVKTGLPGGGDGVRLFPISSNITTADSHAGSFSAACGIHIWQGEALGLRYRDCAFSCDPTGNLVHVDKLALSTATFVAQPLSSPGASFWRRATIGFVRSFWRPVRMERCTSRTCTGKVIEHPDYLPEEVRKRTDFESGKTMGRIWRVRLKTPPEIPIPRELPGLGTEELVKAIEMQPNGLGADNRRALAFGAPRGGDGRARCSPPFAEAGHQRHAIPPRAAARRARRRERYPVGRAVADARYRHPAGGAGAGARASPAGIEAARQALVNLDVRVDDAWLRPITRAGRRGGLARLRRAIRRLG